MKDIRPTNLQKIMNKQAGKSKTHCDKMLVTLKGIFTQAVRDRIIRDNPALDLKAPKAVDGSHRSITDEERSAIISVSETHRFGLFVKTLLWCGLRPQEAVALRWSDTDVINRRLSISKAMKKDGSIAETKSAAGKRNIPIPPQLWKSYEQVMPSNIDQPMFTTTKSTRHTHTSMKRAWVYFLKEVNIALGAETIIYYGLPKIKRSVIAKDLTMYCLRHTYCTNLEAAGVPINVAKYLMGHSNISITAKIYTHMRDDTLSDAAEKTANFGADSTSDGATVGATLKLEKSEKDLKSIIPIKTENA